ncbi:GntR family transcriptional regulator [Pseudothauera nasutitermitis]|uniref:GntR family transcriptional regulator n=1 Tax=Pseudothauera nasutitermitis TaxID=2565930 RepID=A0A4S4AZ58_9RHOO|nr:GntR family transcriptional regulator [Pseudothauera nasutitermitis]THF65448.1 GntR family transcriptional regulator [Pseudothauera nasutitermitis]
MNDDDLLRPRALYEAIADSLRERIFAHELPPGAALDEAALASGYGVSRTPVREAMKVLAHEGLVLIEPRRGCCVAEFSAADVRALFDVLELLEGYAVSEIAHHGLEVAGKVDYLRLLETSGNRYAAEAITRLREKLLLALGPAFGRDEAELLDSAAPALLAALEMHDAAQAERTWREYTAARRTRAGCTPAALQAA